MNSASPQNNPAQSNPLSGPVTALLLFLAAIGIPSAFVLNLITQHPWLTFVIWLLYELGIVLVGFFGKVWQRLESPLVEQVAEWIKWRVPGIFSRYRWRYCRYVVYEHQVFDVKGLNIRAAYDLELEHVFVELDVDPTPVHQASADLLKVPESLRQGEHDIWEYLAAPSLLHWHFVVVGTPGSGKTTLLKHIALALAQERKGHLHARKPHKLPLFLYLRELAGTIKDKPDYSLVDAVQDHIQRKWRQSIPVQWIMRQLTKGRCLILLDGLDEVADAGMRKQTVEWVQHQMLAYGQNRFILTSRPYGYRDNPLDGVTVLEVHPFTPEQVERFVQNWYFANELKSWGKEDPGVYMRAREGAKDLLQRLHQTPALLALAVNPLLLTMIATVHRYSGSLPGKRVRLYREICEVFLGKRREVITGVAQELSPAQKQQVLQPLAYHLMKEGRQEITLEEACPIIAPYLARVNMSMQPDMFLQMVQETSGLFVERNPGSYNFAHKTFQEYLTAVYIKEQRLEQELVAQVRNSWWHETIRLYCAQADATPIIASCLASDRLLVSALTLALECRQEALEMQPTVSIQLDALVDQGVEDTDPERRRIVADALLARRLRQMIHINEETFADISPITCAEYQVFLDEQQIRGLYFQPEHWAGEQFSPGQGRSPILGVRRSDATAFCTWLTAREPGTWHYRLPRASDGSIASNLAANTGCWIDGGEGFVWAKGGPVMPDRIHALASDHEIDLALTRTGTHIYVHDASFANDLIGSRNYLDANLDLDSMPDLHHDFTLAHVYAHDLVSVRAHVFELIRTHSRVLVSDLVRDLALLRLLDHSLSFDLGRELDRILARAHDLDPVLESARAFPITHDLAIDLDRVLTCVRTLNSIRIPGSNFEGRDLLEFINECMRLLIQVLATHLSFWSWEQPTSWRRGDRKRMDDMVKAVINICLDVHASFAILKARKQGMLPAFEGILIMKEYRKQS